MLHYLLSSKQIQLAIGDLPASYLTTVTDISEAIESPLKFCFENLSSKMKGALVCPHVAYTKSRVSGINDLLPAMLNRYGIDALFSPGSLTHKSLWRVS
jgi:hypothetical protein